MFRAESARSAEKLRTAALYDVVNFARRVKANGFYSWGYNDEVCPPTSMYAAFNVMTAPRRLVLALETGHGLVVEQTEVAERWIEAALKPPAVKPARPARPPAGVPPPAGVAPAPVATPPGR